MVISNKLLRTIFLLSAFFISTFTNGSIVVLNGLTHENEAQPGETYRGVIEIQNASNIERSVRVYIRDYTFSYTGESRHDEGGTLERSNANWINFNPELANLGPNEKTNIEFEVTVPGIDSINGTYWSVIMVEGIMPPDTSRKQGGVTINTAIRYAVQIVTNIGKTGTSDLQFLGIEMEKQENVPVLNVMVENTGQRLLKPEITLELFDAEGNSAGILKADRRKTYPDTSIKVSLPLEGIKPGNYSGMLVADCDEDHIYGTNVSFEVE